MSRKQTNCLELFGSLQAGDFLIPQPYSYSMRVESISIGDETEFSRVSCTVFALTADRMPDLNIMRSAHVGDTFHDVRPAIGNAYFRDRHGQLWQQDEAIPLYHKRVQLPGQLYLFQVNEQEEVAR